MEDVPALFAGGREGEPHDGAADAGDAHEPRRECAERLVESPSWSEGRRSGRSCACAARALAAPFCVHGRLKAKVAVHVIRQIALDHEQLLALTAQIVRCHLPRPHKVTDRFMNRVGHPHGDKLAARCSRASVTASRRLVLNRSPGRFGIRAGNPVGRKDISTAAVPPAWSIRANTVMPEAVISAPIDPLRPLPLPCWLL
jgi:hypothetical protein